MTRLTPALLAVTLALLPWRSQAQTSECVTAWQALRDAGQIDNAGTLIKTDCAVMHKQGWLEGAGTVNEAVCAPAWNALGAAKVTANVKALVTGDCAVLYLKEWRAWPEAPAEPEPSQAQAAPSGAKKAAAASPACAMSKLLSLGQKLETQATNLCKGGGPVPAGAFISAQACLEKNLIPTLKASAPPLYNLFTKYGDVGYLTPAGLCNVNKQQKAEDAAMDLFEKDKAKILVLMATQSGKLCDALQPTTTCLQGVISKLP